MKDTIYAPATGRARAAIAVLRVSGPAAPEVLRRLTQRPPPPPRRASLRRVVSTDGGLIDEALVIAFEEGASHTGDAMAEIHLHGGPAVMRAALAAVAAVPGTRLAEPGEFTLRAVEAGRLDLAEAEAIGDLIAAETEAQRARAARAVSGALHGLAQGWRGRLTQALALVEVTIDWADEEVPERVEPEARALAASVLAEIDGELALSDRAERLRTGLEVAILGAPNAGKSTLLNAIAGRPAALTSPVPGTTRDVVELRCDLGGLPVVFLDMAGLRTTEEPVEAAGVAMAEARARAAELRLLVSAPGVPLPEAADRLADPGDLRVHAKADLGAEGWEPPGDALAVSAVEGRGVDTLLEAVAARLEGAAGDGLVAHERQRRALATAAEALRRALDGLDSAPTELVSEDLRAALHALERMIGRVGVEDVLGEVFARFCLGK